MATYIEDADIQATMKAARWTELSADALAKGFALDQANKEAQGILGKTWDEVADVPDVVKSNTALIGRYWLYDYHELVDEGSHIYKDCVDARKNMKELASGKQTGIEDGADPEDNPIRWSSRDRRFDIGDTIISGDDDES